MQWLHSTVSRVVGAAIVASTIAWVAACSSESFTNASGDDASIPSNALDAGPTGDGSAAPADASVDAPAEGGGKCPVAKGTQLVRIDAVGAASFCIDATEVTKAQYEEFLAAAADGGVVQPPRCGWNDTFVPPYD